MSSALFDTAIGRCGIAWGERGVTGVSLPEVEAAGAGTGATGDAAWEARLARAGASTSPPTSTSEPLPAPIARAIADIVALLRGDPRDLLDVALDLDGVPPFHQRVYALTRRILPGYTRTYGELARELGSPGAARAVGQALGLNPFPIVVPCHRVMAAHGQTGGFSGPGGTATKLRMLGIEGAQVPGTMTLFGR